MPVPPMTLTACPKCKAQAVRVIESKKAKKAHRRRKHCDACKHRFTTYEIDEAAYDQAVHAISTLAKLSKVLSGVGIGLEAPSVPASLDPCMDCSHSSDKGCSFDFPEYGTEEAADCVHFLHRG